MVLPIPGALVTGPILLVIEDLCKKIGRSIRTLDVVADGLNLRKEALRFISLFLWRMRMMKNII